MVKNIFLKIKKEANRRKQKESKITELGLVWLRGERRSEALVRGWEGRVEGKGGGHHSSFLTASEDNFLREDRHTDIKHLHIQKTNIQKKKKVSRPPGRYSQLERGEEIAV